MLDFEIDFGYFCKNGLDFAFDIFKFCIALLVRNICGVDFVLLHAKFVCEFIDFTEPNADFKSFLFITEFKEFLCLFALSFKRTDTAFKLAENIKKSDKIFLRLFKAALGVFSFMTEARNACRLLKKLSSVLIFCGNYRVDFALTDH